MRIDSLVAQTLSLSEIATHNWTFRIRGQNFVPSAQVFYRYSSVPFATTFINANELQAVVPPSLRELGSYMLEVRSSVTRDTSNILPLYILDPELQTHDLLDVVRSEVPILTTEEQTLLNQILSRSDVLDARAVYLKRPPEILLSQKLRFSLLQGATATLAMGFPRQVGDGDFTMPGYVENDAQSSSSDITVTDNTFVGTNITVDSDSYTIQPLGNNGVHVIMKKNTTVTNGGECGTKGGSAVVNSETPIIGCDGRTIRVLFLATREVINQYGLATVHTKIIDNVANANKSFQRSLSWVYGEQNSLTLQLANDGRIIEWNPSSETRGGFAAEGLWAQSVGASGNVYDAFRLVRESQNISALRKQYNADIIAILHATRMRNPFDNFIPIDGLASQLEGFVATPAASPDNAFTYLFMPKFLEVNNYLLPHEIGHLLGGIHATETLPWAGKGYGVIANFYSIAYRFRDIMFEKADDITNPYVFSSPQLKLPGAIFAREILEIQGFDRSNEISNNNIFHPWSPRRTNQFSPSQLTSAQFIQRLATNTPPLFDDSNMPIPATPLGVAGSNDALSLINRNAPIVANYQTTNLPIKIEGLPTSLKKGESANITIKLGCPGVNFRAYLFSDGSNAQRPTLQEYRFTGELSIPKTLTMTNDGNTKYINGEVILTFDQPMNFGWSSGQINIEYPYFVTCSDCFPSNTMVALSKNSSFLNNHSGTVQRNVSRRVEKSNGEYLYQNTPNPFSQTTLISFDLPQDSEVKLTVHNAIGQEVLRLAEQLFTKGTHTMSLDARLLPSGIYTYRLQTPHTILVQKMILIR